MQNHDWRFYLYRASDIVKRPLGAYCVQLYRESIGDAEYMVALKKSYKYLNSGKLTSNTLDGILEEADTRAWFKLVRQHLHKRLNKMVSKSSRNLASQHVAFLIKEYNEAYHQQAFDRARAKEAIQTTLAFMRLVNIEGAEDALKADIQRACETLETLLKELFGDESDDRAGIIAAMIPAGLSPSVPSSERSIVSIFASSMVLAEDDQHTMPMEPPSVYTLEAVAADGRTLEIALRQDHVIIGRSPQADLQIEDPQVSRQHLRLGLRGQLTLTDLGSTWGTTMDNERLPSHTPVPWQVGKPVLIGNTRIMLKWTM